MNPLNLSEKASTTHLEIHRRALPDGGFAEWPEQGYRPDATAWAVLAFSACNADPDFIQTACARLAESQLQDGRVALSPRHPEAFWPTTLAVLAWLRADRCHDNRLRGSNFLLSAEGRHWPRAPDSPVAHDTDLVGWPWIANTHPWVEPTSLAFMALKACGLGRHPRAAEARKLLLNRQLPGGGWNYGNTLVYGQQLDPMPDATGIALEALAGDVERNQVAASLAYLEHQATRLATPQSLSWCILGLSAWQRRPPAADALVASCLARQDVYGPYGTSHLCQLLLALDSKGGLSEVLRTGKTPDHGT